MTLVNKLKDEFFGGWKPFELAWLFLFLAAQIFAYVQAPDSLLAMISGIAGILCVVFVGKGKISNYLFGLIFAYTYFYVALDNKFYGEMTTTLYVYIPAQFIGYFLWKQNMQSQDKVEVVEAKFLTVKGWLTLISAVLIGSLAFISILKTTDGQSVSLDGVTTVLVVAAQLLMILRYSEQWILWIIINILSIWLWAETPAMYLMYGAYLLNSVYGYYNWTKLAKKTV
ncbi:nicotinamide riboside transporter PnuC [Actinobacillus porcinus]|uniref:Nicotinamide riboside transporter PnuC n=1 Tax=Actinobacillus porcinus TaxID=51048 RepID=A0ABY6TH62_9PAST|nr:nicotinamide riboside transporter PnuC [Actinobacillus porcinus]MCI5764169.1 nicotinamide riboside transporter PnuC [Actinobacillus porcinus]MDD7544374.1 nicotinamide riboside transporter PnuC [Actinobacillus porcinus]MDY5420741.1 nicotinamide riboside transporter PnuC [Actinobacillus porcinus]MDY5848522.1 nicotinamide riboside transporter PnuC [Actinobacillus porcinus]MDY6216840.1 nicotinamide riboside transporter PnuC [Actinobacillus porcinus]